MSVDRHTELMFAQSMLDAIALHERFSGRDRTSRRRASAANGMAKTALTKLHPDDYRALYEQAKAKVAAKAGPLPGDPQ